MMCIISFTISLRVSRSKSKLIPTRPSRLLIIAQAEVYQDGNIRLQLMREDIPILKRLRAGFMINTDKEFMVDFRYIVNKNLGFRTHYDSDMGFGIGLNLNY